MSRVKVGIRELKTKLSAYVQAVEAGTTVIITERGKAVGRISAIQPSVDLKIRSLEESGLFRWSGNKFAPAIPTIKSRRGKKMASIVLENRR
jgi:prevent-host-death family protein